MYKTPYPFQEAAIERCMETMGQIVADECGLGKTLTAIETAKRVRQLFTPERWRCLIICPPALIPQWEDEIADQDPGIPAAIVNRLPVDVQSIYGYLLMSIYDLTSPLVREAFQKTLLDMVIVDEAHRIKNRKTKTARWIKHIPTVRRIALTGTPMEKNPADLWSILNFIAPQDFPAYWGFVMRNLIVESGYWEKYIVGGPKDPEAFGELLSPYMIRRTKEEVVPELPEKLAFEIRVPLNEPQKELYDEIRKQKDILVTAGDRELFIPNALALLTRLQQISAYPPLLDFDAGIGSAKLDWLATFMEDHPNDKLVVFTRFRNLALHLREKYDAGVVVGGLREIPDNPSRVIGTIDAMGEGLNFQWAKHAIFLDSHWSTIKMTQAVDRIHRVNIKEPKNLYFLWSTAEDRLVLDAMNRKMSESELVYYFLNKETDYVYDG